MHAIALLALIPFSSAAFSSIALRSASPIHFQPLQARTEGIWVGGKTQSFCPDDVGSACPPGNATVFQLGGGAAAMDVEVPGGQQLYVGPDGALSYTIAHSGAIPKGSYTKGFKRENNPDGNNLDYWSFTGGGATDFLACPVKIGGKTNYRVYANVKGFSQKKCLGFTAVAQGYKKGVPAWQYT